MTTHALHIGINNYPGRDSDLAGCVNDAHDMAEMFSGAATQTVLVDGQAKKLAVVRELMRLMDRLQADDWAVITWSSHGTYAPDRSGDEADGFDEAFVAADFGLIYDDQLQAILADRHPRSLVFLVTDSCHSGTVHRMIDGMHFNGQVRPRFLPAQKIRPRKWNQIQVGRRRMATISPRVIHFGACQDDEFSYDASFGGRAQGAYTHALKQARRTNPDTFGELLAGVRRLLPTKKYPQTPRCNAHARLLDRKLSEVF